MPPTDPSIITIKFNNATTRLTRNSDIDDLEHALLLATSRDIKLADPELARLKMWVRCARRHHISIIDGSTHHILDMRRLPLQLLRELEANVMHYGISQHHLPLLQTEIARQVEFRNNIVLISDPDPDPDRAPARPDPLTREFYRYLLAGTPASALDFVTRFCAQAALGRRPLIYRMSPDIRARRLEILAAAAKDCAPDFLLAADQTSVYIIRHTDGELIHKWFHHAVDQRELVMLPDHQAAIKTWIGN